MVHRNGKTLGFILLAYCLAGWGKSSEFTPSFEYEHTFSDNIFLSNQDELAIDEDVDIYRFGLSWDKTESFWTSAFDSTYEEIVYHSVKSDRDQYHKYHFDTRVHDKKKRLQVGVRASQDQVYSSFLRTKVIGNVHLTENQSEHQNKTAYIQFKDVVGGLFDLDVKTSVSEVDFKGDDQILNFGDRFDDNKVHSYRMKVSDKNRQKERWFISAEQTENRHKNVSIADTKRRQVEGEFYFPIENQWQGLVKAGEVTFDYPTNEAIKNGSYVAVGVSYWAPSKYRVEAVVGELYSEASAEYYVSSRTSFSANYINQKLGLLPQHRTNISLKTRTKKSELQLTHQKSIETYATEFVLRFDEDGEFETIIPTSILPDDPLIDPDSNELITNEFVLTKTEFNYLRFGRKLRWNIKLMTGEREPVFVNTPIQEFRGGSFTANYQLNRRNGLSFESMSEISEYHLVDARSDLEQHTIRYNHKFSEFLSMQMYLLHLNQEVPRRGIDVIENRAGVILRSTF